MKLSYIFIATENFNSGNWYEFAERTLAVPEWKGPNRCSGVFISYTIATMCNVIPEARRYCCRLSTCCAPRISWNPNLKTQVSIQHGRARQWGVYNADSAIICNKQLNDIVFVSRGRRSHRPLRSYSQRASITLLRTNRMKWTSIWYERLLPFVWYNTGG